MKLKGFLLQDRKLLIIGLLLWTLATIVYLSARDSASFLSGLISLSGQAGLDILAALLCFSLAKQSGPDKKTFSLFYYSFSFAAIADLIFNYLINIKGVTSNSVLLVSLYDIPFAAFLLLQAITWRHIYTVNTKQHTHVSAGLPFVLLTISILSLFLFATDWKIQHFSLLGFYQIIDTAFEAIGFIFATFCLIRTRNTHLRLLALGFLIIIASDLNIRFGFITLKIIQSSVFEMTWMLGLLLICIGLTLQRKEKTPLTRSLVNSNSIQTQLSVWFLLVCLATYLLSMFISGSFSAHDASHEINYHMHFLSALIFISIFAALTSNIYSLIINRYFRQTENSIKDLYNDPRFNDFCKIEELKDLQNIIIDTYRVITDNDLREIEYANKAKQVEHDLRSPLSTITLLLKHDNPTNDAEDVRILRKCVDRIKMIASDLGQHSTDVTETISCNDEILLHHSTHRLIQDIICEKNIINNENNRAITIDYYTDYKPLAIIGTQPILSRVLSNIIDNAIDALGSEGHIGVSLTTVERHTQIVISDNGSGISQDIVEKIFDKGFSTKQKNHSGLGLFYSKLAIERWGGSLQLDSSPAIGTTVLIKLPSIYQTIKCHQYKTLAIIEDDITFSESLQALIKQKFPDVNVVALKACTAHDIDQFIQQHQSEETFFVVDHDLQLESINGFNLIRQYALKTCALITGNFRNQALIRLCAEHNIRLLPKIPELF